MKIILDCREKDLITLIRTMVYEFELEIEVKQLPLGDIIIAAGDQQLLIIERKTLRDLAASIKDGRYKEQSFRLDQTEMPNHNIMYMIEGSMQNYKSHYTKIPKRTLYSAILELNYRKGFSVMKTQNIQETAEYILRSADKMRREIVKDGSWHGYYNGGKQTKEYCSVVKKVKKNNLTADNIASVLLCQVPGISAKTALAIMNKYSCLYDLLADIKKNEKCLDEVMYETKNGKKRHISKNAISNIITLLCGKPVLKINI